MIIQFCLLVGIAVTGSFAQSMQQHPPSLALIHTTVLDLSGGTSPKADRTVLIRHGRIERIAPSSLSLIPEDAKIIDAQGKFLLPGLWDMHAHPFLTKESFFPGFVLALYLANGITGIRDMFGPLEEEKQWVTAIQEGMVLGPRIIMAGPLLDGPNTYLPGALIVKNAVEARAAVRTLKKRGSDFIKVHDFLSRESYYAIAEESKRQQIPFVGHIPPALTPFEISDAGQKSVEHFGGIPVACSFLRDSLQPQWAKAMLTAEGALSNLVMTRVESQAFAHFDEATCRSLGGRFAQNHTWQDPTLVMLRARFLEMPGLAEDPRLLYIPRSIREEWTPAKNILHQRFTPEDFPMARRAFPGFLRMVNIFHQAGVKFLAGTDPPQPNCLPGFSLHDELSLYVEAGLSPLEALRTATWNPAEFFGMTREFGSVEAGKVADLLLLEANPLADIHNTRKITGVVAQGRYYSRVDLDRILAQIADAAKR